MNRTSPDILERFRHQAAPAAGFRPREGAVLAVSGGPDSMALLDLVVRAGTPTDRIVVAHLDHAIRPESREDARFVADQARAAGVRCRMRRRDVRAEAVGSNLEQKARSLRYEFLEYVAGSSGLPAVATGHHLDDQAETVMLRLIRGTGPEGLRSIPPSRAIRVGSTVRLVRPLLPFRREEIVAYLAWRGLPYRIDPTNLDGSNARSRIRGELLPRLAREVPDLADRLAALADRARKHSSPAGLREEVLTQLPPDGPMLDRRALERIEGIVFAGHGTADLGAGWTAGMERGRLVVLPPDRDDGWPALVLPLPGTLALPDGSVLEAAHAPSTEPSRDDPESELVDAAAVAGEMIVRPAGEDGRFRPLGANRETTVLRFLKTQRVPERHRRTVAVVWSGGVPIWVVGYRIDERAALCPSTAESVRLRRTSSPPHRRTVSRHPRSPSRPS